MPLCMAYPGLLSMLVMDNAQIHHGDEILELVDCFDVSCSSASLGRFCIEYLQVSILSIFHHTRLI